MRRCVRKAFPEALRQPRNVPETRYSHIYRWSETIAGVELPGEPLHVPFELGVGNGGVNLRGADVPMAQQLADGLDGDTLRQRDRRGERVARDMEGDRAYDSRLGEQPAQAGVAPAVARQGENRFVGRVRQLPGQDGVRNGEKPDIHLRTGLAACRADPELPLRIADIRGL